MVMGLRAHGHSVAGFRSPEAGRARERGIGCDTPGRPSYSVAAITSMSTCTACASPVTETQRYCPACGTALDVADDPTGTAPRPLVPRPDSPSPPRGSSTPRSPHASGPAGARPGERFAPGTVLGERYRIVGLLGRGGMGEVYRADDLKLEQPVALKFLPRALEGDPERLERLYGEVRMARQVSHPAVCRVWDVGEAEGQHFLSMEFVDGENLASLLRRIGRLPRTRRWTSRGRSRRASPPRTRRASCTAT